MYVFFRISTKPFKENQSFEIFYPFVQIEHIIFGYCGLQHESTEAKLQQYNIWMHASRLIKFQNLFYDSDQGFDFESCTRLSVMQDNYLMINMIQKVLKAYTLRNIEIGIQNFVAN